MLNEEFEAVLKNPAVENYINSELGLYEQELEAQMAQNEPYVRRTMNGDTNLILSGAGMEVSPELVMAVDDEIAKRVSAMEAKEEYQEYMAWSKLENMKSDLELEIHQKQGDLDALNAQLHQVEAALEQCSYGMDVNENQSSRTR